jgi:hypothetical protein
VVRVRWAGDESFRRVALPVLTFANLLDGISAKFGRAVNTATIVRISDAVEICDDADTADLQPNDALEVR